MVGESWTMLQGQSRKTQPATKKTPSRTAPSGTSAGSDVAPAHGRPTPLCSGTQARQLPLPLLRRPRDNGQLTQPASQ